MAVDIVAKLHLDNRFSATHILLPKRIFVTNSPRTSRFCSKNLNHVSTLSTPISFSCFYLTSISISFVGLDFDFDFDS